MDAKHGHKTSRGTAEMGKYMNDINEYPQIVNFVMYLNKDQQPLPSWEQKLIVEIKQSLQFRLRDHFDSCAKTRSLFVSMSPDIWKESGSQLFNLTEQPRAILGYLPKYELARLNDMIAQSLSVALQDCRTKVDDILDKIRASDADRTEVNEVTSNNNYVLENVEAHEQLMELWQNISTKKSAALRELEDREKFLYEIDEFEKVATDSARFGKHKNSINFAKENKFRSMALKKIEGLDKRANQLCVDFQKQTGRTLQVDGIDYLEHMKQEIADRSPFPNLTLLRVSLEQHKDGEKPQPKHHYLLFFPEVKQEGEAEQVAETV